MEAESRQTASTPIPHLALLAFIPPLLGTQQELARPALSFSVLVLSLGLSLPLTISSFYFPCIGFPKPHSLASVSQPPGSVDCLTVLAYLISCLSISFQSLPKRHCALPIPSILTSMYISVLFFCSYIPNTNQLSWSAEFFFCSYTCQLIFYCAQDYPCLFIY